MLLSRRVGLPAMNSFPIVGARIHPPLLRPDVLSRERLNEWLEQAVVTGRVVLVVAEAGFGKTTLLGDWARQSRRPTAWYRLEPDDRDWLTFARHLVASGRELDPGFAPGTYAMLMGLGPGGPTREDITGSLAREIAAFGSERALGLTLIFDDYQAVDGSDEVVPIVRALLERTGPQFRIVIATRSAPRLPLGRLRARGAVARLTGDALRFEPGEADRLFRDAYHLPLERELIDDLVDRTDGWAALLSLVRANLEEQDRPNPRALVAHLDASAGDLYDYLAEEVLEHLPNDFRDFLVRVSILDDLDPVAASLVTGLEVSEVDRIIAAAEDLALIQRPDPASNRRFVPLVRDLLRDRQLRLMDEGDVRAAHWALAQKCEGRDWRRAATHYRRAGDSEAARRVVGAALDEILATGQYRAADDLLADEAEDEVVRDVLRSRVLLQLGASSDALELASRAVRVAQTGHHEHSALAAQNAATISVAARRYADVATYVTLAESLVPGAEVESYSAFLGAAGEASLPAMARRFERMLHGHIERGQLHYAAITSLNLAQLLTWLDRTADAIRLANDAEQQFASSSRGYEVVSVRLVQAQARAFRGDWETSERLLHEALNTEHPEAEREAVLESAELASWFGRENFAAEVLQRIDRRGIAPTWMPAWGSLDLWLEKDRTEAERKVSSLIGDPRLFGVAGATFRWHLTIARAHLLLEHRDRFRTSLTRVEQVAELQGSPIQRRLASVLRALGEGPDSVSKLLANWPENSDPLLGVFARTLSQDLGHYSERAASVIARTATQAPYRWRGPLREVVESGGSTGRTRAASLIEQIGEPADVALLRGLAQRDKRSGGNWGDSLMRRLAPRLVVEDLGPASLYIGSRQVEGRLVRRKVLALLTFLASQPNGSATPEQVLEAIWPGLRTEQGVNSVHQTVYFLRRVIDNEYRAGLSPEYVHFNSDMIWLDRSLVDCRSWICRRLLVERPETPRVIDELLANYRGRFAPEFAYEDWAAAYRDGLHAAFLAMMERAVGGDLGRGDMHWRLWVGQQTLMIDPEADAIEALTIRLYRALGAVGAAAEQYAHYSSVMREQLGIDPPAIEDL